MLRTQTEIFRSDVGKSNLNEETDGIDSIPKRVNSPTKLHFRITTQRSECVLNCSKIPKRVNVRCLGCGYATAPVWTAAAALGLDLSCSGAAGTAAHHRLKGWSAKASQSGYHQRCEVPELSKSPRVQAY